MDASPPNDQAVRNAIPSLHAALEHLIRAWDHLHDAEQILGIEITTQELSDLSGALDSADDVRHFVTESHVRRWLGKISFRMK